LVQPDWLVCVHEAGHIVAAHLRGGNIKSVSVEPRGETLGEVYAEFQPNDWRSLTIFYMSGFWAQHHIYGTRYPWTYARFDQAAWERTLREHSATRGAEQRCFRAAEAIVLDHEALILDIAKALQQGQDKDQICHFLSQVYPKGTYGKYKPGAQRRH
jgi:hypothetical protein